MGERRLVYGKRHYLFSCRDSAYSMQFGSSRQPINLGQRPEGCCSAKDPEQMSLAELREHIGVMRRKGLK